MLFSLLQNLHESYYTCLFTVVPRTLPNNIMLSMARQVLDRIFKVRVLLDFLFPEYGRVHTSSCTVCTVSGLIQDTHMLKTCQDPVASNHRLSDTYSLSESPGTHASLLMKPVLSHTAITFHNCGTATGVGIPSRHFDESIKDIRKPYLVRPN
jgi:hypothetical protein